VLQLKQFDYFGERALLNDEPRAASVYAVGATKCLVIGRKGFEDVLGPLEAIIDTDRRQREGENSASGMLIPAGQNSRFPQVR
jgi:CRP-like cAMP-binding protein